MVRQRSAKPSSAGSIPAVASKIPVPKDFAFAATVESHGWYRLAPFRWDGKVLRRMEVLPEGIVELEIVHRGNALHVRGARDSEELRKRVARMFQLYLDLAEFMVMTRSSDAIGWFRRRAAARPERGAARHR